MLKLEQHLKDSKKNSSAQIMELSAQIKSIYEEVRSPPLSTYPIGYYNGMVC